MSLNVTIPDTFNGPLGLLHSLIVRDEIDIYDIPIAKLTASYCEEIEKMEVINIDEGAEFLDLASRLKEIKLRMLLPPEEILDGEDEDEDDAFDPRSSLVEALLEYRRFKDAARLLTDLADEQARRHPRVAPRMQFRFVETDGADGADSLELFWAMQNLQARLMMEGGDGADIIQATDIPISTRIEQIQEVLTRRERTRFSLLLSTRPDRNEMVGFFVALLELLRRGGVTARQTDNFSDIILELRGGAGEEGGVAHPGRIRPGRCFPEASCMRRTGGAGARRARAVFPCAAAMGVGARAKVRVRAVVSGLFAPVRVRVRGGLG